MRKRRVAARGGWSVAALTLAGGVLAATTLAGAPASAASATFNPFDVNGGFTVVSLSDAHLSNSELEGSIAVLGSISSGNQNGYPVIHKAAGRPDYTVPVVDGVPVRILAGAFTGTGAFDVSNRDDSASISPPRPRPWPSPGSGASRP